MANIKRPAIAPSVKKPARLFGPWCLQLILKRSTGSNVLGPLVLIRYAHITTDMAEDAKIKENSKYISYKF